jgi:hypothetical protein
MPNGITKETYKSLTTESKLNVVFDVLIDIKTVADHQLSVCGPRFIKLEKRKWLDKGIAAASGFGGGFTAVIVVGLKKMFL